MSEPEPVELRDRTPMIPRAVPAPSRAIGSPLSMGSSSRQRQPSGQGSSQRLTPPPALTRALPAPAPAPRPIEDSSGIQRVVNVVRTAIPIVQRLLPLIDGNVATAVVNLIAARPRTQLAPPKVDLGPLEEGLANLQAQHRGLREQMIAQDASLKRVEDRLEMVREATDRNTLEQQELLEDLKTLSGKVKTLAVVGISLLAVGFLLELMMFFHLQRVLP